MFGKHVSLKDFTNSMSKRAALILDYNAKNTLVALHYLPLITFSKDKGLAGRVCSGEQCKAVFSCNYFTAFQKIMGWQAECVQVSDVEQCK